ncbi:hypothetical protein C8Q78DRAFT_525736 [Trametes maxima]|nr:hypothetical protein C8Q78DRAFT_525736 [Trametes maxima]
MVHWLLFLSLASAAMAPPCPHTSGVVPATCGPGPDPRPGLSRAAQDLGSTSLPPYRAPLSSICPGTRSLGSRPHLRVLRLDALRR